MLVSLINKRKGRLTSMTSRSRLIERPEVTTAVAAAASLPSSVTCSSTQSNEAVGQSECSESVTATHLQEDLVEGIRHVDLVTTVNHPCNDQSELLSHLDVNVHVKIQETG